MVSWEIAIGLLIIAIVLPFFYLRSQIRELRSKNSTTSSELEHLRMQQKQAEALQDKEKSLFLEALGVPFLLVRPSGRLVMANKKAGELLDIDPECRMNLLRMLPDSPVKEMIANAVKVEETVETDFTIDQRGETRYFRSRATPLGNADKHIGIVIHDITEEQRTLIIRKEFVANASHELRTPLTIIRGYLETLLDAPATAADAEQRTRSLKLMKQHADRIVRLVEDMLNVSRLETTERSYLRQEDFDLAEVLGDVRLRMDTLMAQQQATLCIDMEPVPFTMCGDKFYWSQILFNLMENAVKNNPQPGLHLFIHARKEADGSVVIEVQDNGVGILPGALPYIFNRFYRADTTGKIKGTGLGLSIVKHAVEAHGGTISAKSEPGKETTFRIAIPAKSAE